MKVPKSTRFSHKKEDKEWNAWHLFVVHLSSLFFSLSSSLPLPSALSVPQYQAKRIAFAFFFYLRQRSYWSQDLLPCFRPICPLSFTAWYLLSWKYRGVLDCCWSLIRQGQSNPDDRKVGKWVEICFILWTRFSPFLHALCSFSQKANYVKRKMQGKSKIIRNTKMSPAFLAVKEVRLSLRQSESTRRFVHLGFLTTRHIVPPADCFIISLSKCLSLAKCTEALLCASRCHFRLMGSTGEFWR